MSPAGHAGGLPTSEEAGAEVDAIGGDHQRNDQADAAEDGDDFQDFDVNFGPESLRESSC
jgi:hypothetical protein